MYEEEEETDIASQLIQIVSKPKKVLHREEFIPVKKTTRKPEKHSVERQRTKKSNNNIAY